MDFNLADFNLAVSTQTPKQPNLISHQIFRLYSIVVSWKSTPPFTFGLPCCIGLKFTLKWAIHTESELHWLTERTRGVSEKHSFKCLVLYSIFVVSSLSHTSLNCYLQMDVVGSVALPHSWCSYAPPATPCIQHYSQWYVCILPFKVLCAVRSRFQLLASPLYVIVCSITCFKDIVTYYEGTLSWLNVKTLERAPTPHFGRAVWCSAYRYSFLRLQYSQKSAHPLLLVQIPVKFTWMTPL